ncbi:collagenase [Bowmanella dokdonensis]|uniref:microbial collagenase n=1 Tax=Bowmanella dokdonensis TaxID=751969 RepID=A0A939IR85_9ALTE|nr:collagenase [Bowmanella dokdonensis]MBN7825241.1 collagenase [Bowmanella dokdonensis]
MNKISLLLTGLLLSAGLAVADDGPGQPQGPQLLRAQELAATNRLAPKPPRTLSPIEFQRQLQQSARHTHHSSRQIDSTSLTSQQVLKSNQHAADKRLSFSATTAGCSSAAELQNLGGDALVEALRAGNLTSCLYGLYDTQWVGTALFSDANMLAVVQAINSILPGFDGSDASGAGELEKLVTYLRALHWAETSLATGRSYPAAYRSALAQAFTSYFGGAHFVRFDGLASRNFMLRYEILILVNSSQTESLPYLPRFAEAIIGYATSVSRNDDWGLGYEERGMTQLLTHYFNAVNGGGEDLKNLLLSQPQIIDNLQDFILNQGTWLVGHTREYQWSDAITELARMLKFSGPIAQRVRPALQTLFSTYSFEGAGANGWINAQSMVLFYDAQNCDLYGDVCDFDLQAHILSGQHACSSTIKIRFQQPITDNDLDSACAELADEEQLFHHLFGTSSGTPVTNDYNTDLEVVIFSSSTDYQNYAGNFFDIDTDNGGMYLEGDPNTPGNQARFIAFQATWLQPEFVVWNLRHEYIHYLDGRFNKWGSYEDQADNSVWWAEGLAEYLSMGDTNANALAVAADKSFALSEVFQTTYAHKDISRTYHWGYLAVRFMFENQRGEIDNALLPSFRAAKYLVPDTECQFEWGWQWKQDAIDNNWYWLYDDSDWASGNWVWTCGQQQPQGGPLPDYTPYDDILQNWSDRFDGQFDQWLDCLLAGQGQCEGGPARAGDLDGNGAVDSRDIELFISLLRQRIELGLEYDFNRDNRINQRDVRALMALCDQQNCAIAP